MLSAASGRRLLSGRQRGEARRRDAKRRTVANIGARRRRGYHPPAFRSNFAAARIDQGRAIDFGFRPHPPASRRSGGERAKERERETEKGHKERTRSEVESRAARLKVPRRTAACYQVASFYCFAADEGLILFLSLACSYLSATRPSTASVYICIPLPQIISTFSFHLSLCLSFSLLAAAFSSYRETEAPRLILLRRRVSLLFLPQWDFLFPPDIKPS